MLATPHAEQPDAPPVVILQPDDDSLTLQEFFYDRVVHNKYPFKPY